MASDAQFVDLAKLTYSVAGSETANAVKQAWSGVGITY